VPAPGATAPAGITASACTSAAVSALPPDRRLSIRASTG